MDKQRDDDKPSQISQVKPYTVSTRTKIFYTSVIYFTYFTFGINDMIVATAMDDVVSLTKSDVASFSAIVMVSKTVSYCVAAILGSCFSLILNRQLYLVASLVISAAVKIWLPLAGSLTQAAICQSLAGVGAAGVDVAVNAWLLAIWRDKSESLMQAMHFCYAVGSSLSPLMTEPFMSNKNFTQTTMYSANSEVTEDSLIHIPLWMGAALYSLSVTLILGLHIITPYDEKNENLQDKEDNETNSSSFSPILTKIVLSLASLILMFDVGTEASTFDYNTIFVSRNGFNQHKAAFVSSVKSISYTVSRAAAAVIAIKVPIRIIIYLSIVINAIGNGVLLYSTHLVTTHSNSNSTSIEEGNDVLAAEMAQKESMMWLGFALVGFGFGPLYPAVLSFVQNYIKLTTFICGIFAFVGSWSSILNFLVVGKFIEHYVNVLTYFNLISISGLAVLFITLDLIVKKTTVFKYSFRNKIFV